jgi:bifunctional non-homologous end joining protein LigD
VPEETANSHGTGFKHAIVNCLMSLSSYEQFKFQNIPGQEGEITLKGHALKVTNLDKLYWKEDGFTKGNMLKYYLDIAPYMLPYMKDRPQSLHRHPNGITGKDFFQKDMRGKIPGWIPIHEDYSESTGEMIGYMICNNEAALLYMANLGCIEMHPWHSRRQHPEYPDYCIIDLDPDKSNTFDQVIETAHVVKALLDDLKASSYCKTSGSTGLHIYVPLGAKYKYEDSKQFAEMLVNLVNQELPDTTSVVRNPSKRKGKIYLDFLQNSQTQTAAAPYSLRPKPGMPVSTPLDWSEVKKGLTPVTFNATNILDRLKAEGDIFEPVLKKGVDLKRILKRLTV